MAVSFNFRSAIGGFNREDVVRYIELMNSKHTTQVNQLATEIEELRRKLEQVPASAELSEEVAELTAKLEESNAQAFVLEQQIQELTAQRDDALAEIQDLKNEQEKSAAASVTAMELEAYRRAEQAERQAKARAEQIYQQATGTLAQATTQVDSAAIRFREIAEQVSCQMNQLQLAVDSSKNALLDAATTMYTIHSEDSDN